MEGCFDWSTMDREGKFITRIRIYFSRVKPLSFLSWKRSNIINLQPGCWLISLGNDVITRAKHCPLLLAKWALRSSCSQIRLGEWKSISLSPCVTAIPATMKTLFLSPLGNDRGSWGQRLIIIHRSGNPIYLIIKIFLCWPFCGYLHDTQISSHPLLIHSFIHIPLPQMSLSPIFILCFSPVPWPASQIIGYSPWVSVQLHI